MELSESRRYEIAWPEDSFVAVTCQAKDSAVHLAATFTSIAGAIGVAEQKRKTNEMLVINRGSSVDTQVHAGVLHMTLTAVSNLLSSVMLAPIYTMIAIKKVISCTANDAVVTNVLGGGARGPDATSKMISILAVNVCIILLRSR